MVHEETKLVAFGASLPKEGRSFASNEDAFAITSTYVALADGAGDPERAARRVQELLDQFLRDPPGLGITRLRTWGEIFRALDHWLRDGPESTLVVLAKVGNNLVGAYVGNSRAYLVDPSGRTALLTERPSEALLGSGNAEAVHLINW